MPFDHAAVISEIDQVLREAETLHAQYEAAGGWGSGPRDVMVTAASLMLAAIDRLAPPESPYRKRAEAIGENAGAYELDIQVPQLPGILRALRADYAAGRLEAVRELIHADVFSDFLDMAQYLVNEGYWQAAAVIAGSTLEGHLHKLCGKFGVPTVDAAGKPAKASSLNTLLRKTNAYDASDEKNVTAWLALRNHAAHGDHSKYTDGEVKILILAVREFVSRRPA